MKTAKQRYEADRQWTTFRVLFFLALALAAVITYFFHKQIDQACGFSFSMAGRYSPFCLLLLLFLLAINVGLYLRYRLDTYYENQINHEQ